MPPLKASSTAPTRTNTGSIPQYRATPPQRPVNFASVTLRRIVQIDMLTILPSCSRPAIRDDPQCSRLFDPLDVAPTAHSGRPSRHNCRDTPPKVPKM